jgi:hypothetical protein
VRFFSWFGFFAGIVMVALGIRYGIGIGSPRLLLWLMIPGILHMVPHPLARLLFAAHCMVLAQAAYVICDITTGPHNRYHHVAHDLLPILGWYGLISFVVMLAAPRPRGVE